MYANRISPNRPVTATALACGLSLAAASSALGQASGPDASVAVFADHFVFENAATMWAEADPTFFDGTVVEGAVKKLFA